MINEKKYLSLLKKEKGNIHVVNSENKIFIMSDYYIYEPKILSQDLKSFILGTFESIPESNTTITRNNEYGTLQTKDEAITKIIFERIENNFSIAEQTFLSHVFENKKDDLMIFNCQRGLTSFKSIYIRDIVKKYQNVKYIDNVLMFETENGNYYVVRCADGKQHKFLKEKIGRYEKLGTLEMMLLIETIMHTIHIQFKMYIEEPTKNIIEILDRLLNMYHKDINCIEDIENLKLDFLALEENQKEIRKILLSCSCIEIN